MIVAEQWDLNIVAVTREGTMARGEQEKSQEHKQLQVRPTAQQKESPTDPK